MSQAHNSLDLNLLSKSAPPHPHHDSGLALCAVGSLCPARVSGVCSNSRRCGVRRETARGAPLLCSHSSPCPTISLPAPCSWALTVSSLPAHQTLSTGWMEGSAAQWKRSTLLMNVWDEALMGKLKHLQMKANCGIFDTTGSNFVLFNVVSVQATGEPLVRSQLWIFGDLAFCSTNAAQQMLLDTENATACSAKLWSGSRKSHTQINR